MDPLDSWLSRQVGWRYAMLAWLQMCPGAIVAGCAIWDSVTPGLTGPGLAFFAVVAWSLFAAVLLAGVFMAVQCWRRVRRSRSPAFSWRAYAGVLCIMTVFVLNLLTDQQPYWHHVHRAVGLVSLSLGLIGVGFCLEAARRSRLLSKSAPSG
jgi:uncharacterized membrane protein